MKTYTIKPLEWSDMTPNFSCATPFSIGRYSIFNEMGWKWQFEYYGSGMTPDVMCCDSLDQGKALAQADWESRLLPALEEAPEVSACDRCGSIEELNSGYCKNCF